MSLRQKEVLPGIWHIGDDKNNFCTLIVGETGAVLFDTTMGFDDLRGCVAAITHHEPTVICSHNHFAEPISLSHSHCLAVCTEE